MEIPPREDEEIMGRVRKEEEGLMDRYDDNEMRKKSGQICVCVCNVETISIDVCRKERKNNRFLCGLSWTNTTDY